MSIKDTIEKYLDQIITDDQYFLVDILISGNAKVKVTVLIDGDDGVDIDYCASISRQLGSKLEEDEVMDSAYVLEVSSPGLDYPLMSLRQYTKNIGRRIKVDTEEGTTYKGTLLNANDASIVVNNEVKEKGKKKITEEETEIPFQSIKKTKVLVSFK